VWFVTDPERTPDPLAIARRLPKGAGVIFRHFGRRGAETVARALSDVALQRGLRLLIGADAELAIRVRADGVHLPERDLSLASGLKAAHPDWIVTAAAHSRAGARRALRLGADAVLVSAVFQSLSSSAGEPLGRRALARIARSAGGPVYALGGVNDATARRLLKTGVAGLAAVEGLSV